MKRFRWLFILAAMFVLLTTVFVVWAISSPKPMPEAERALQSNDRVTVERSNGWMFTPAGDFPETGLVFYPGGRVDPVAYAPLAQDLASAGYAVIVVPMPLNLAVFGIDRGEAIITRFPQTRWVIGGHSLGGAMAAAFAHRNPGLVDGLVLLAAYPAESNSLADSDLPVLSISAQYDGLATSEDLAAARTRLPAGTQRVVIAGGNHAQFGWYGLQSGDGQATISRAEQQSQVSSVIIDFLAGLED